MSQQELAYWQAQVEQEVVLDATPDPDYDLDDDGSWLEELNNYYNTTRL